MHLSSDPNQYSIQDCSPGRIIYIHTRVRSRIRVRPPTQIYGSAISATTRAALSIRWALRTSVSCLPVNAALATPEIQNLLSIG